MMKWILGFLIGVAITSVVFINLIQIVHVEVEKLYPISYCSAWWTQAVDFFGEDLAKAFRITFKILSMPVRTFQVLVKKDGLTCIESLDSKDLEILNYKWENGKNQINKRLTEIERI